MATGGQSGTLNLGGATPWAISGTGTSTITLDGTSATVNYSGGAQTVWAVPYHDLTLSGSGAKTTTGATVNGILSREGTATTTGTVATYGAAATLQYKGSSTQTTGTEFPATFGGSGGIIIDNASGVNLGGSVAITNGLTLTSGAFAVGANTLTLNGPTIAGTPANLSTTSSSSLVFGGSSTGVNIPGSVATLNNLTINNTNGVTLNNSPTVSGTLTLASGKITTGANTLIIASGGSISGGGSSSYVNGNLRKAFNTGSGQSFTFTIGGAVSYTPVALASMNVTSAGNLTAHTTAGDHPNIAASQIDATKSVNRYWALTIGGGFAATYGATFNYPSVDVDGAATPSTFIVNSYSSSTWSSATVSGTPTTTQTSITGEAGFGDFAIGERYSSPVVNNVNLTDTAITPLLPYTVTVNISHSQGKTALNTLVLKLWYDSSGTNTSQSTFDGKTADTQNCAIITWTQATDSFAIQPLSGTTWVLGSCTSPASLPGDFTFHFTPGKVATATSGSGKWQVTAKVTDNGGLTGYNYDPTPPSMNWYGEVTVNTPSVTWTGVTLGSGFDAGVNNQTGISVTFIANGNYKTQVLSSSSWSGGVATAIYDNSGTCSSAGRFAMEANSTNSYPGALVTTTGVDIDTTGVQTPEAGTTVSTNALWLKVAQTFRNDTYDGTITYVIANR
ncbi:MAG: hypothetical protein PHV74_08660 [Dehalococcoidia bacterium]|nr:hypothetical protein [Dehalococcoidia bacterium]